MLALAVLFGGAGCIDLFAAEEAVPPAGDEVFEGQSLTLRADVEGGEGPFHYLWFKDYMPIHGATTTELKFESLRLSDAGTYWVTVFNDGGSTTSPPEILNVRSARPSRMVNVSIVGSAPERLIVGFSLGGGGTSGSTSVLARAAGPALTQFGIVGALADPVLSVFQKGTLVSINDDWSGDPTVLSASAAVGAFPFSALSKDSAVLLSLTAAAYSAEVVDSANGSGVAVVELYDATPGLVRSTPRLTGITARGAAGDNVPLTAGFTIEGDVAVTILVRGLGPALDTMGVTGGAGDPKLRLFRGPTLLSMNENWNDLASETIREAQAAVGAVALDAGSLDAALLISLSPGSYSAQVSSSSAMGTVQVEIYEVP